jgi:hypothetical protein
MALPTPITVTGTYLKMDGSPEEGSVVFRSRATVSHELSEDVMSPSEKMVELDVAGSFSIEVPSTDDPDWTPDDWTYKISVNLSESVSTFNARIPYDSPGGTISISTLIPVPSSQGSSGAYAPLGHSHSSYVEDSTVTAKGDILVATAPGVVSKIPVGTNGQVLKAASGQTTGLQWAAESGGGGAVDSVNGETGVVVLDKTDIGLGNVDNTSDAGKPVSTAQQTALDLKANLASPTFTGTVSGVTKSMVGLGNVDNTADTAKPVSTAQQTALDLKANLASPTFTGTVGGITKSMVGLGNVDNTADTAKPVSTAQQTALDGKSDTSHNHDSIYVRRDISTTKGDVLVASGSGTFVRLGVGTNGQVLKANSAATNGVEWGTDSTGGGGGGAVDSVNGQTGDVVLTKTDLSLGNVDNVQQQPIDADLTDIAALTASNDDIIQRKAGAWTNRTVAQFKSDLSLTKSDVGLSNVDNTSDSGKPVSTAQQTALDLKANLASPTFTGTVSGITKTMVGLGNVDNVQQQPLDSDLTSIADLTATNDDIIQRKAGAWTNRTVAQFKSDLALTKTDVGLGNVDNLQQQPIDSDLTAIAALSATNDDIIQRKSGAWTNRTVAQFKTDLTLTKSDVGLGNVDNTSDANKPVSTAQQTALNLKPNLKAWNGSSYSDISNGNLYVGGTSDPTVNNGDVWVDTQSATDFTVTNNLLVGGNLTVSGVGAKVTRVRSSNATARSTATMSADDVLTATLGLGTWIIRVSLFYLGSGTTADFQVSYTVPTGSLYNRSSFGILAASTATGAADKTINHQAAVAVGTGVVFATTTTADFAEETLVYNVTTSGTFAVSWARSGASETATLLAGSCFIAERIV